MTKKEFLKAGIKKITLHENVDNNFVAVGDTVKVYGVIFTCKENKGVKYLIKK